jgi:hypothetical protein
LLSRSAPLGWGLHKIVELKSNLSAIIPFKGLLFSEGGTGRLLNWLGGWLVANAFAHQFHASTLHDGGILNLVEWVFLAYLVVAAAEVLRELVEGLVHNVDLQFDEFRLPAIAFRRLVGLKNLRLMRFLSRQVCLLRFGLFLVAAHNLMGLKQAHLGVREKHPHFASED